MSALSKVVMTIGIIVVIAVIIAIATELKYAPSPLPLTTIISNNTIAVSSSPTSTTISAPQSNVNPYLTTSQAESLLGAAVTTYTIRVYNTTTEVRSIGSGFAPNATAAWIVMYGVVSDNITVNLEEIVVQSPKAQDMYQNLTAHTPSNNTASYGAVDGMNYGFLSNTLISGTWGERLLGWKGDYMVFAGTQNTTTINGTKLATAVASRLP